LASWKAVSVFSFYIGTTLGLSAVAGVFAWRRQQPAMVWASGLLLPVAGTLAWSSGQRGGPDALLAVQALCLAIGSVIWTLINIAVPGGLTHYRLGRRTFVFAHAAVQASIALIGLTVVRSLAHGLLDAPLVVLQRLDWLALTATAVALTTGLWDRTAKFSLAGLYAWALIALGMAQIQRGFVPARFLLWGAVCDLAGVILVAALIGWGLNKLERAEGKPWGHWTSKLRIPDAASRWSGQHWFHYSQALLAFTVACLTVWIAADVTFDGMGQGVALFGLSGRSAACPAALMLLGTAILMAWQSGCVWRAGWQYAALAAGVLFTTSLGWAMMDPTAASPWLHRGGNLLISTSMMTVMTGVGLGRFLPRHSDWISRGRRAMPAFAMSALVLLVLLIASWLRSHGFR